MRRKDTASGGRDARDFPWMRWIMGAWLRWLLVVAAIIIGAAVVQGLPMH